MDTLRMYPILEVVHLYIGAPESSGDPTRGVLTREVPWIRDVLTREVPWTRDVLTREVPWTRTILETTKVR